MWWKPGWRETEAGVEMVGAVAHCRAAEQAAQGQHLGPCCPGSAIELRILSSSKYPQDKGLSQVLDGQEASSFSKLVSKTQITPLLGAKKFLERSRVYSKTQANTASQSQRLFFGTASLPSDVRRSCYVSQNASCGGLKENDPQREWHN